MKVLYISTYVDEEIRRFIDVFSNKTSKPAISAIKYSGLIKDGLETHLKANLTNLYMPSIGMFPNSRIKYFHIKNHGDGRYIPFINIVLIKQLQIAFYIGIYGLTWVFRNLFEEKKVVLSSINLMFLVGVLPLKLFGVKVVSFVPDLPQNQYSYSIRKKSLKLFLAPIYVRIPKLFYRVIDYYVFITKYMVDQFPKRPYCIIEGFVDRKNKPPKGAGKSDCFSIMYAGALNEKFGIRMLIETFEKISGKMELWLFGIGDLVDEIKKHAKKDPRIIYFGRVSNDEIIEYEYRAHLLINPRFTSNEFTKYSFPSKLMEYMVSGTPVLTTRLAGIPDDYLDKMYFIEEETSEGFNQAIMTCYEKPEQELVSFGVGAQTYVLSNKNSNVQIAKVLENIKGK